MKRSCGKLSKSLVSYLKEDLICAQTIIFNSLFLRTMENPSKKLKLDHDYAQNESPVVSDPFKVFENRFVHIRDKILSYLTGKDVLNCFLVSKDWNKITSQSTTAMSKIKLHFKEKSSQDPAPREVTALLNSQRQYQNLKFVLEYKTNSKRKFLLIERFGQSLKDLELVITHGITWRDLDADQCVSKNLNLPNLKVFRPKIKPYDDQNKIVNKILKAADNLEEFQCPRDLNGVGYIDGAVLASRAHLKRLIIDEDKLEASPELLEAKFQLNYLDLWPGPIYEFASSPSPQPILVKFCQNQAETLKTLRIVQPGSKSLSVIWFLPKLENLIIGTPFQLDEKLFDSHPEPLTSIRQFICYKLDDTIKIFVKKVLVNLDVLKECCAKQSIIDWMYGSTETCRT